MPSELTLSVPMIVVPGTMPPPFRSVPSPAAALITSPTAGRPWLMSLTVSWLPRIDPRKRALPTGTALASPPGGMLAAMARLGASSVPRPVLSWPVPSLFCTAVALEPGNGPAMLLFSPVAEAVVAVAKESTRPMLRALRPGCRRSNGR